MTVKQWAPRPCPHPQTQPHAAPLPPLLRRVPDGFSFTPKHKSTSYTSSTPAPGSAAGGGQGQGEQDDVAEG